MANGKTKPRRVKVQWMGDSVVLTVTPEPKTVVVTSLSFEEARQLIDDLQESTETSKVYAAGLDVIAEKRAGVLPAVINFADRKK